MTKRPPDKWDPKKSSMEQYVQDVRVYMQTMRETKHRFTGKDRLCRECLLPKDHRVHRTKES